MYKYNYKNVIKMPKSHPEINIQKSSEVTKDIHKIMLLFMLLQGSTHQRFNFSVDVVAMMGLC